MIKNLKIRPYRETDEKGILALMNAVYGQWHGLDYWRWKYKENPLGFFSNWIWVAEANGEIVGHYAMMPVRIKIGDGSVLGAQTVDVATHPDHRRHGIFETLAKNAHAAACGDGMNLTYTLPALPRRITAQSGASYKGFQEKLGWTLLCFMARMVKGVNQGKPTANGIGARIGATLVSLITKTRPVGNAENIKIERMDRFGEDVDLFWEKASETANIMIKRDSDYLNWRISNPDSKYAIFGAREGREFQGYIILKVEKDMGVGIVVDLLALPNHREVVSSLLLKSMDFFSEQQVPYLRCWITKPHPYCRLLKQLGCVHVPARIGLLFRTNWEETRQHEDIIRAPNNWFITSLDSDHV